MSQERKELPIDLDFLYVKYGQTFTNKIHAVLKQYGLTQKYNSLGNASAQILALLKTTASLDVTASVENFELLLSAQCVQATFYKVYQLQLAECLAKGNDLVHFNKGFKNSLEIYTSAFINTKLYPAPLKDFIAPAILKVKNPPSFSSGGKPSDVEQMRWFADIPLYIKDDQAVEIVNDRLNRDMNFLKTVFNAYFNELKQRQARNESFIETGIIKPLEGNVGVAYEIGENHLENTIATFYHYGINGYKSVNYDSFLGFDGKNRELLTELNLPTNATLFALTALLVMEHPKITPSWLQKLQLFNENGKLRGYIQAGEQHILTSDKDRRGRNLAQQDVVLNEYSKSIVDFIVQHTDTARQHLKSIGNPDWKFLLLTCSLNKAMKPSYGFALYKPFSVVKPLLNNRELMPLECNLSQQDIDTIASITTHRSIRRHRGLQIYLETRSQSAVADALGHKEVDQDLMDAYLPKPLMDFFTERVVRQFQKAIILEAMKDSPYLLDAVNMTYEEIEEFLANHGLNDIPDFKATSSFDKAASQDEQSVFNKVVFTITLPLLQLLMSIKTIIDNDNDNDNDNDKSNFNELVQHWYQCATYLFRCIEMPDFDYADIQDMYQEEIGRAHV